MLSARQDAHGRYENPDGRRPRGLIDVLRWKLRLGLRETSEIYPRNDAPPYRPDLAPPDLARIRAPEPGRIQATWVGHSTWLLQIGGWNLLTDPHWSERASPVSWTGPRRIAPPAVRFEDLPPIDAVLVSHNHYDHLDLATVRRLADRGRNGGGSGPGFYVPLGLGKWFASERIGPVVECGWGESATATSGNGGRLEIGCVPAQHWSSRSPWDRRKTLWCGWRLRHRAATIGDEAGAASRIFFAGDTAWTGGVFDDLGREHGPFDLALLPIGAYAPRWFMADQHADPRDAVRIHRAIRSRRSLGMHWGTFVLTDELPGEPPRLLDRALAEADVPEAEFRPARLGETVVIGEGGNPGTSGV